MILALMIYDPQLHWIDRKCRGAYSTEIFHCIQDNKALKVERKLLHPFCNRHMSWLSMKNHSNNFYHSKNSLPFQNDVFDSQYAFFGFANKEMSNVFDYRPLLYISALTLKAGFM